MQQARPDVMVLWNPQSTLIKDYLVAARKTDVPVVVVITSWDMPTTKGPICPGAVKYIVNSTAMKSELTRYHQIDEERILVSGWPQMDVYTRAGEPDRKSLFDSIGVPVGNRLIVFAANSERLGRHEPSVVEYMAKRIVEGAYGSDCTLLIRPHPKDGNWERRFRYVVELDGVVVESPDWGRLDHLSTLMRHADVVVASQGSITMDAVAQDTCVINIGFDGNVDVPENESVRKWYLMDHYRTVMETDGVWLVDDFGELDTALAAYLENPELKSLGRKKLRAEQLEPMDGKASMRVASTILDIARGRAMSSVTGVIDSVVSV
jgi:CDP-glycerol glycerophosphotransferase (TagB/SpsB family)